ncbi:hypothetical protein HDU79_005868 [Rhizoclosmatium sp. JEL0117]|nr:hypothetical protein HDU79_005868 [Rhizoclosmatium sp. JEL0117]
MQQQIHHHHQPLHIPQFEEQQQQQQQQPQQPYLGASLAGDFGSAMATSLVISPVVTVIDRSIIANASGKTPLVQGLKDGFRTLATKPHIFLRQSSFLAVFTVYAGTYATANTVETLCTSSLAINPAFPKFLSSTTVNIALCAWKDKMLTKWYGVGCPKPFPKLSYGLFIVRDSLTVAASFTLPPIISKILQGPEIGASQAFANTVCQLGLPCAVQLISTPIHLFSLDLYNREGVSFGERVRVVKRDYLAASVMRMGRVLPAFGFGQLVNVNVRAGLTGMFSS